SSRGSSHPTCWSTSTPRASTPRRRNSRAGGRERTGSVARRPRRASTGSSSPCGTADRSRAGPAALPHHPPTGETPAMSEPLRERDPGGRRRYVILGPPASGKGTQGQRLAAHLGVPHVSTGQLLRRSVESGDPYRIAEEVSAGRRV